MAQSKSFFGLRRGSTKSLTFSTFNGKQVTKDRVTDVKNPRTEAQMINRMLNYTAMSAYSAMKEIVDHSFASKSYGLQSMRHFLSRNYSLLKYGTSELRYSSYKGGAVPSLYLVSEGSLPKFLFQVNSNDNNINFTVDGLTFADLKRHTGLNSGDYFTVVALSDKKQSPFTWIRLHIPSVDIEDDEISLGSMEMESNVDATSLVTVTKTEQNKVNFVFRFAYDSELVGTIISSAKRGDTWQRSTNYMQSISRILTPNYADALATYPVGASYILNGGDK